MPIKLLYDYDIFARQKYGGISRYFYELISGISNHKELEVNLFLGINNSSYNFSELKEKIVIKNNKFSGIDKFHFLSYVINEKRFNSFTNNKTFNLFHKTYYSAVGLKLNTLKVITIHDMTHELYPQYFAKSDQTSEFKKKCIESSDGIICVSNNTKMDLMNMFNLDDKKIKVIYHGISLQGTKDIKRYIDRPYILYVGQRWGYKNFNLLLTAYNLTFKLKNNYILACFGGGDFNISEKLYLKHHNLSNNVFHLNGNDSFLISLYKYASGFVYTSVYEGFGFPPLEAMVCGCPVLASSSGSVKEIAGDAALLFDPSNIEDLINKLELLLHDSSLRNSMVERGFQRAKLFSWDRCVNNHIEFYNELMNLNS